MIFFVKLCYLLCFAHTSGKPLTALDEWTNDVIARIDEKYMQEEGVSDVGEAADVAQLEMTNEVRLAAESIFEDLETGFPPKVMEEAAANPYYFIDRQSLAHASGPVVEPGLWYALIRTFYALKRRYLETVQDMGNKWMEMPDRLLLLKMKDLSKCRIWRSKDDEKWETLYLKSVAKSIGRYIPIAMAGKAMYTRGSYQMGRIAGFSMVESSDTPYIFMPNSIQKERHRSVQYIGQPRFFHLGSLTFFDVLARALYIQDQVQPFDYQLAKIYHLFAPTHESSHWAPPEWNPSPVSLLDKSLVYLLSCLGEIEPKISTGQSTL